MRLTLTGLHVSITPALQALAEARLAKLERRLDSALVSANVVLTREKTRYVVELTAHVKGDHMLHGAGKTASWSTSMTAAVQKVMQQAETIKGKWQARKHPRTPKRTE